MQQKTFGELLKDSWELYTTQFKYILLLVVFFYFPFQLITTFTLPEETLIPTSFGRWLETFHGLLEACLPLLLASLLYSLLQKRYEKNNFFLATW